MRSVFKKPMEPVRNQRSHRYLDTLQYGTVNAADKRRRTRQLTRLEKLADAMAEKLNLYEPPGGRNLERLSVDQVVDRFRTRYADDPLLARYDKLLRKYQQDEKGNRDLPDV